MSTAFGWYVGNIGEALLAAACIRYFEPAKRLFDSVRSVIIFLIFGFLLAPLLTSFLDAAVVVLSGWDKHYWDVWTDRLFSNMLSQLIFVPTITIIASRGRDWLRGATRARWAEAVVLWMALLCISLVAFGREGAPLNGIPALIYAPLPLLLWAAVRFETGGLCGAMLTVAMIAIVETIHGRGPFIYASARENALYLQLFLGTISVPMVLLAAVLAERRRTEAWLRNTQTQLITVQEQERRRIARELHDDVGQRLALVEIELAHLGEVSDPTIQARVRQLSDHVSHTSKAARDISRGLHPSILEHLGLGAAVRRLCQDVGGDRAIALDIAEDDGRDRIDPDASLCLYRVAQEALHNVEKHSRAHSVSVELGVDNNWLVLRIHDDGVGFVADDGLPTGLGLTSMRERLRAVEGMLDISSERERGTTIRAAVPLDNAGA